jgi:hypothetical protein
MSGIIKLPRVLVKNDYNAYFSIPLNSEHPIIPCRNGLPCKLVYVRVKAFVYHGLCNATTDLFHVMWSHLFFLK